MKKLIVVLLTVIFLLPLHAVDLEKGLSVSGGVKTGLLIRNRDFGGELGNLATSPDQKYPMTLHFASYENNARNGVGWLNFGYSWQADNVGNFGAQLGLWANGNINSFNDLLHLGDHFVWASFFEDRFRFIGGQGGGTPINSGGWINADWLGYTGLRLFWVDPSGISAGIIFPDPGDGGIKPVNYLSLLGAGIQYKYNDIVWASLLFDNSPIYDDSESNYYGGLHRPAEQDPIALAGNIAFGIGVNNIYGGKGQLVVEGLFTNLGEDETAGMGNYTISPVATTIALKTGLPVIDNTLYAEVKGKYTIRQGDNGEFTSAIYWGKLELEPYISFNPISILRIDFCVYWAMYINSYYLALDNMPTSYRFNAGQVPDYSYLRDYLSPYQLSLKPRVSLLLSGVNIDLGYTGHFSRDHVDNTIYIDFKWSF